MGKDDDQKRKPPIKIPLKFEQAIDGLLKVDSKQPVEGARETPVKKLQKDRSTQAK